MILSNQDSITPSMDPTASGSQYPELSAQGFNVVRFAYQSRAIKSGEWIAILTLCFAPLAAHILIGAPKVVVLGGKRPHWTDRVCLYGPTSIFWRYLAIADRRARSRSWNPADMAASCTAFWTGRRWDGSELMMMKSRAFLRKTPKHHHIKFFSFSMVKTLIVLLQGILTTVSLIQGRTDTTYRQTVAVTNIYTPLATFGLFRVFAALWLEEDYSFETVEDSSPSQARLLGRSESLCPTEAQTSTPRACSLKYPSATSSPIRSRSSTMTSPPKVERSTTKSPLLANNPTENVTDILVKLSLLLLGLGILVLCFLSLLPLSGGPDTIVTLLMCSIHTFYSVVTMVITLACVLSGNANTTVIPVIGSLWYKAYTLSCFGMLLVLFVVSMLETRRSWCGLYTTYPMKDLDGKLWDDRLCGNLTSIASHL
ncbi:hypothetical protein K402DRAFT_376689 [Aulographum hederae CBS 113979]|uniref:Uncharacterized protein n=1 Tax=Aulographum hederae CBS 113979 TaxID=1176131 RepID=A0A6G1H145_9PEZI|nr:hypothetical protein K402DRAFT_376689 [Aulographum hederae CBS 113979]